MAQYSSYSLLFLLLLGVAYGINLNTEYSGTLTGSNDAYTATLVFDPSDMVSDFPYVMVVARLNVTLAGGGNSVELSATGSSTKTHYAHTSKINIQGGSELMLYGQLATADNNTLWNFDITTSGNTPISYTIIVKATVLWALDLDQQQSHTLPSSTDSEGSRFKITITNNGVQQPPALSYYLYIQLSAFSTGGETAMMYIRKGSWPTVDVYDAVSTAVNDQHDYDDTTAWLMVSPQNVTVGDFFLLVVHDSPTAAPINIIPSTMSVSTLPVDTVESFVAVSDGYNVHTITIPAVTTPSLLFIEIEALPSNNNNNAQTGVQAYLSLQGYPTPYAYQYDINEYDEDQTDDDLTFAVILLAPNQVFAGDYHLLVANSAALNFSYNVWATLQPDNELSGTAPLTASGTVSGHSFSMYHWFMDNTMVSKVVLIQLNAWGASADQADLFLKVNDYPTEFVNDMGPTYWKLFGQDNTESVSQIVVSPVSLQSGTWYTQLLNDGDTAFNFNFTVTYVDQVSMGGNDQKSDQSLDYRERLFVNVNNDDTTITDTPYLQVTVSVTSGPTAENIELLGSVLDFPTLVEYQESGLVDSESNSIVMCLPNVTSVAYLSIRNMASQQLVYELTTQIVQDCDNTPSHHDSSSSGLSVWLIMLIVFGGGLGLAGILGMLVLKYKKNFRRFSMVSTEPFLATPDSNKSNMYELMTDSSL